MNNIVLIGMPGCGKSTVGVVLAKIIGYKFLDTDLLIQEKTGKLLQEMINELGNNAFLEIEANVIETIDCERHIIATGGSAVLIPRGVAKLKSQGKLVYLKHPFDEISNRISNLDTRGITLEEGQTLKDLYDYRSPIYEKVADIIIDANGLSIEQTARMVINALNEKSLDIT